ncbi:LysE family translocator [Nonomuraea glycinis]|jgi:threonine/homoserine/homoserine lactone efflux protein|uniref:Lysine transporter LysE n=1 Tax=Nonomuraea glycinis TaxID=2047744 RepID=A0A918E2X2_9ACTN|nr:LysE family translocator [Nonomuraea glycinis]MCA2176575.1 LysE family translocator [Nonomuraea glycinis]WSG70109.1 LysE family translocator [Nonomuraea glycinis]GGP03732.1 lysine transporter LysE [Nonomuraea glycinis]
MLLTFVVTTLVMIMIPGPDAALIMRSSLAHGRMAGLLTMLGGLLGLSVHAAAAAIGLSALLVASPAAFTVVRALGVCYLLWLGVHALLAGPAKADRPPVAAPGGSALGHVRRGLLSNLLNPKVLLLFVTWLPQFLPAHGDALGSALLLSAIVALLYALWFSLYNLIVDRAGTLLRTPRIRARIERVTGVLLVGFALRLAVQ